MKKSIFTLIVAMLLCGNVFAQDPVILISDSFEDYEVGAKIASSATLIGNDWWTTWGETPGNSEDGVVAELNGVKCGHLKYGNDQVLILGDEQSGTYNLEFDILVPEGKNAYFNILHDFAGSNSEWAMQSYFHLTNDGNNSTSAPGRGTIHAGSNNTTEIVCYYDEWMHFRLFIDTDRDIAEYYYTAPGGQEAMVCSWQWSLDSFGGQSNRKLAAMNFYPPENASTSEYYIDNFKFTRVGGETAAELVFNPETIEEKINKNETKSVSINIENTGTSIAEYSAYVDYGVGQGAGAGEEILSYALDPVTDPAGTGWDYAEPVTFEMATLFPASQYGTVAMGTYVTGMMVAFFEWVDESETVSPTLLEGSDVTFRIYGQGMKGVPGEVLAEKTIKKEEVMFNQYTMVYFDEPVALTGFDVYAAIEVTQAPNGTSMNFDGGEAYVGLGDLFRQGKSAFASFTETTTYDYGNWCHAIICEGASIAGGYAILSKSSGSLAIGASEEIKVNLSSYGLADGKYEATVMFYTNVPGNEEVTIPLTLEVGVVSVDEMSENVYTIYPNPTEGQVVVEGENISYIAIYNATGQLVNVVMNNNVVDMSSCDNGVYFFNVVDNAGKNSVQRVVVAK